MKKLLALTLSVLMLISIIPFGASAITVDTVTDTANAHDVLKEAIEKGTDGLNGTAWSIKGGATADALSDITPSAVESFKVRKNTNGYVDVDPGNSPDAYVYNKDTQNNSYLLSITAYEQSENFVLSDTYGGKIPQSGILVRNSDAYTHKSFALTYTAPKDGRIRLYDPTGAQITAVQTVNGINTGTLDVGQVDGVYSKRGTIAVYKNGTVLWEKNLNANSRHFDWPEELQNITVFKDETIKIVISYEKGMPGILLAMNPQIDYIEAAEKPDSAYLCISEALKTDKLNGNTTALKESSWQVAIDADGSDVFDSFAAPSVFKVANYNDQGWPAVTPYESLYGYGNQNNGILPYNLKNDGIALTNYAGTATAPSEGVLINAYVAEKRNNIRLTYIATDDGKLRLYDATDGNIAVIKNIGTANSCSITNVKAEIRHNDETVWNNNGAQFNSVAFPDLNLDVSAGDMIEIVIIKVGSGADMCVALNPTVEYSEDTEEVPVADDSNAHDVLKEAIKKGTDGLNGTAWSIKGGATADALSDITPYSVEAFTLRDATAGSDIAVANAPDAYALYKANKNSAYITVAAYEQSENFVLADTYNGEIPQSGIIMRHSDLSIWLNGYISLTYTAPKDGRIRLYDPTGAQITAVQTVNGINTGTLDVGQKDGVYSKRGTIAVYKNGTVLWEKNLNANSRHFDWPEVLQNITVNKGDEISIVVSNQGSMPGIVLAMNPQISYKQREAGDLNDNGSIDIVDLIRLKKLIASNKYDVYGDLDGDGSLNTTDLVILRKYLLGIISIFPVNSKTEAVTSLKTTDAKTYMVKGENEALPFYGVFIRADQIASDKLETYFEKANTLGFRSVVVPIKWCEIEGEMDSFDFTKIDTIYSYLEKYDLDMQLIWYGSDNCGYYSDCVPSYVSKNTKDYPIVKRNGKTALDYSNDLLVAREVCAVTALMNHIADIDTKHRLVVIQIENEANSVVPGSGDSIVYSTTAAQAENMHFVGGQKAAILNLVNRLGLAVKSSRYPCVTRFSFASYICYNNGSTASLKTAEEVLALEGIDAVGTNGFEPNTVMDSVFLKNNVGQKGNLPHIAEAPAGVSAIFKKLLNAFSLGGGMLVYQLNETGINGTGKNAMLSIYDLSTDFKERTGKETFTYGEKEYYYAASSDWKSFNGMMSAVGGRIAAGATQDTFKLIDASDATASGNISFGDKSFEYKATKPSDTYGTVGFVMQDSDGAYLLYSLKDSIEMTLPDGATVTSGAYNNGVWSVDSNVAITNNSLRVTGGTVYRVTF